MTVAEGMVQFVLSDQRPAEFLIKKLHFEGIKYSLVFAGATWIFETRSEYKERITATLDSYFKDGTNDTGVLPLGLGDES